MRPVSGFAAAHALLGVFDGRAPRHCAVIARRRQHALEHLPVELARGSLDDELGALAGLGGRLAHDAGQGCT